MDIITSYFNNQKLVPDKDSILRFFIIFSRFEYALKRAGYFKSDKNNGVKPDWDRFASGLKEHFNYSVNKELTCSIDYLKNKPPLRQILKNNEFGWEDTGDDQRQPLIIMLICYIKRVRNNLFHGGKFPLRPIEETARDCLLLNSSLTILNECLRLSPIVRNYFLNTEE